MRVVVTGGLGFIGSALIRWILDTQPDVDVINLDCQTYAGNPANLIGYEKSPRYRWVEAKIQDADAVSTLLASESVDAIVNCAAESHVDRSIADPEPFISTNVLGTEVLLHYGRRYSVGKYLQMSTDEVYGSLGSDGFFTEESPLDPSSPYSASKASADLLVLAHHHTYAQNVVITRCSNNYGPYQYPEKLIPLFITNGVEGKPWPLYGDGNNIRDWIYVMDHVEAVWEVLTRGQAGRVYNVGARNEHSNREVALELLRQMELPETVIVPVDDRLGHDRRYAIDPTRLETELGWHARHAWLSALDETVSWYRQHETWWKPLKTGEPPKI
jgi:dTDP-glucose 4,6-dehydratase